MTPVLSDGTAISGSALFSVIVRYDLVPIPASLEMLIKSAFDVGNRLSVGSIVTVLGIEFEVVKCEKVTQADQQTGTPVRALKIIALHAGCVAAGYVRKTAIIKENTSLAEVYSAAGAKVRISGADFIIPRFSCLVGQIPTYGIQRALHEVAGGVRIKNRKLEFLRLQDAIAADPFLLQGANAASVESEFLERSEVPTFFATDAAGALVVGDSSVARRMSYAHGRGQAELYSMSKVLIHAGPHKMPLNVDISAGDCVVPITTQKRMLVITAVHAANYSNQAGPDLSTTLYTGVL